jgi:formate hydrogenlyase subunit 4
MGLVTAALQCLMLLAVAPGLNGFIKTTKARLQTRRGPGLLQGYYDLAKWLSKGSIYSEHASWISRVAPLITFGATITAGLLVPAVVSDAPLSPFGDLITVIYLFVLARFATALAGLDAGGSFGGMGSSREMAIAALTEPVLLLALFVQAVPTSRAS